jgi:flagellar hook-basal body complex protein FliE
MEIPPIQMPIMPIQTAFSPMAPVFQHQAQEVAAVSFKDMLQKAGGQLNDSQVKGAQAAVDLATGRADNLHDVVLSMEQANLSLQYAIQVRNKLLEAYQSISSMQI